MPGPELMIEQHDQIFGVPETDQPRLSKIPGRVRSQAVDQRQQHTDRKPRQSQPSKSQQKTQLEELDSSKPDHARNEKRHRQQHKPVLRHAESPNERRSIKQAGIALNAIFQQQPKGRGMAE